MDRWQWVDAFREANIDTATLMNMNEQDFQKCCNFLVDAGIAPLSYLVQPKKTSEEEELDRIIEESNKIKEMKGKSNCYQYQTNCNQKYDMHKKTEDEKSETKTKDIQPKCYVWNDDNENEANRVIKDKQENEYNRL